VLYCLVDGKYAGWAFTHKAYEHYPDVMLYVYKKYRRNKIGTNLFKLAKKVHKVENIDYTRHDKISRAFFNSVD
jgi:GNAT superfamily N-acetyltransferase